MWEQERTGMMDEIKDLEKEHAHIDQILAKEKFKMFAFKWRMMNKINKMKFLERDSFEFNKAWVEVSETLKIDIDTKISIATEDLKSKYEKVR